MESVINVAREIIFDNTAPTSSKKIAIAISMISEGVELNTVAKIVGVTKRQIRNYQKRYFEQGAKAFTEYVKYRPISELDMHKEKIKEELVANPVATAAQAAKKIEEITGIKRCPTQIRIFMKRLGLKPLKTAAIPAKANPKAQEQFLNDKLEPRIEEAKEDKRVVLFMDAAHFVWQAYLGVLWCLTRIFIPAAAGRTRVNVLGAYDPITNTLIKTVNRGYINSATIIEMLNKIREHYSNKNITIVLDNAKYQRCLLVQKHAESLSIELLFLPTYSPNLNLIERLWRYVKKECLYSNYYDSANKFEESILECLNGINTTRKGAMKKLMTLKFQLFKVSTIMNSRHQLATA